LVVGGGAAGRGGSGSGESSRRQQGRLQGWGISCGVEATRLCGDGGGGGI
jgi:hypothetical protein